jgi:hypothetical protein
MKKLLFIALVFCITQLKSQTIVTPSICMATTDTASNNNIIYWDKTPYTHVDSFIVYRETMNNVFSRIGAQPYTALSKFKDTARSVGPANGDPTISAYRYTLQIRDSSENYSALSPYHTTIYTVNGNGNGTFVWNLYTVGGTTVTPVAYFNLMRDDNSIGHFVAIASTSNTQTALTDPNYSTYAATATWRVDAMGFNCTPTLRSTQTTATTISHSNPVYGVATGIKKTSTTNQINIYPNPAQNSFTIQTSTNEKQTLSIFNINGKQVLSQTITGTTNIDAGNLNAGIYDISLINNESVINKRLVIVKQ